ncbi:Cof-like hydrolase [Aeromicrobium marinum DSM 15272]|uniref:Cof-like hydrolase n=1 Tax=Aeromicrobium marinum DSM 15272 TaxID=585531 RepID=E2S8Y5_9ACTN|nr:HAD family hydrolase [Aeromicrobium marinum]EFQ84640.1 Cof-like hydrolase [Aeromicrobium marinum DSM 15272]
MSGPVDVWRPRLVALDVDGTIVDGTNTLAPAVREAVRAVRDAGIETVISTGRAIPGVIDTTDQLGLEHGYAVASNGSVVFSYAPVEVMQAVTFDASTAVREVLEHVPDALVAVEDLGRGFRLNRPFPESEINGSMTLQSIDELIAEPVTRVVIRAPDHSTEEFHAIVAKLGLADTNYYIGYTSWLDIAPKGVSKASGLAYLCGHLGLTSDDVLAVGDGNNDVEMLAWAGHGVAMGQAPPALLEVADEVTGSIDEDGLAAILQRYL